MTDQLDWTECLSALMDFQGYSVMVQVGDRHEERRHTPVLSAFGVMLGGLADSDGIMHLSLADRRQGNNGLLTLRQEDFESATRPGSGHLLIKHAGLDVYVTRGSKTEEDELGPDAGGGLYLGRIVGPEDPDASS